MSYSLNPIEADEGWLGLHGLEKQALLEWFGDQPFEIRYAEDRGDITRVHCVTRKDVVIVDIIQDRDGEIYTTSLRSKYQYPNNHEFEELSGNLNQNQQEEKQ